MRGVVKIFERFRRKDWPSLANGDSMGLRSVFGHL